MPYEIGWRYAPLLMQIDLTGKVTEDEITNMVVEAIALLRSEPGKHGVNTVINMSDLDRLPGINVLQRELSRLNEVDGRENGINIVYGLKPFARYMVELLLHLTPLRFKVFDARDDAELFAWQLVEIAMQAKEARQTDAEAEAEDSSTPQEADSE